MRIIVLGICVSIVLSIVQSNDSEISGQKFSEYLIRHLFTNGWKARYVQAGKPNELVSPFPLEVLLMTLAHGAHGKTLKQLLKVLGLPEFPSGFASKRGHVRRALDRVNAVNSYNSGISLHAVNKIFISNSQPVNPNYIKEVRYWYKTEVQTVDFAQSLQTTNLINKWVEDQTNHRITGFVSNGDFDISTSSLLVSTLHFSGMWHGGDFLTKEDKFYPFEKVGVKKKMLFDIREVLYTYSEELSADILELPFEGSAGNEGNVSMLFFLPVKTDGLADMQDAIARQPDVLWSVELSEVHKMAITIPQFNIETSLYLRGILRKMGVYQIFRPNRAELDKISPGAVVQNMVQKIFINVTANGVEATAAADAGISLLSLPEKEFKADHPFVFSIRMRPDNLLLFSGVYSGTDSKK